MSAATFTLTVPSAGQILLAYSTGSDRFLWIAESLTVVERESEYVLLTDGTLKAFVRWDECTSPAAASKTLWMDAVLALIQAA